MAKVCAVSSELYIASLCWKCKEIATPIAWILNEQIICDECHGKFPEEYEKAVVNKLFNACLKHFSFPCKYKFKGCHELVSYEKIRGHHEECNFNVKCPFANYGKCNAFRLNRQHLYHHLKTEHKVIQDEEVTLDDISTESIIIAERDKKLFIFKISVHDENKYLSVYYATYVDNEDVSKVDINSTRIDVTKFENFKRGFEGDLPLNNLTGFTYELIYADAYNAKRKQLELERVKLLSCPKCKTSLVYPPVQACDQGHYACDSCRADCHNVCDLCHTEFKHKNRQLNSKAYAPVYPCFYEDTGCQTTGKLNAIKSHIFECNFMKCPINGCTWIGNYGLIKPHLHINHKSDIVIEDNNIFYVIKGKTSIYVMLIGTAEEAVNYKFNVALNEINSTSECSSLEGVNEFCFLTCEEDVKNAEVTVVKVV